MLFQSRPTLFILSRVPKYPKLLIGSVLSSFPGFLRSSICPLISLRYFRPVLWYLPFLHIDINTRCSVVRLQELHIIENSQLCTPVFFCLNYVVLHSTFLHFLEVCCGAKLLNRYRRLRPCSELCVYWEQRYILILPVPCTLLLDCVSAYNAWISQFFLSFYLKSSGDIVGSGKRLGLMWYLVVAEQFCHILNLFVAVIPIVVI